MAMEVKVEAEVMDAVVVVAEAMAEITGQQTIKMRRSVMRLKSCREEESLMNVKEMAKRNIGVEGALIGLTIRPTNTHSEEIMLLLSKQKHILTIQKMTHRKLRHQVHFWSYFCKPLEGLFTIFNRPFFIV